METLDITSRIIEGSRSLCVQPPPSGKPAQCFIFLDGELYLDRVDAPAIVEQLQRSGAVPPTMFLYLGSSSPAARHKDFICNDGFTAFLVQDLLDSINRHFGRFEQFYLGGLSLSGLAVAHTLLEHPLVFQGGLCQSPSAWWNNEWLAAQLCDVVSTPAKLWISVGDQEQTVGVSHPPSNLFQGTSQLESVRRLFERLNDAKANVQLNTYTGGHDPKCWADELPSALSWLLGGR